MLDGVLHAVTPHFHVTMKAVLSSGVLWTQTVLGTGKVISCTEAAVAWDSKITMREMACESFTPGLLQPLSLHAVMLVTPRAGEAY